MVKYKFAPFNNEAKLEFKTKMLFYAPIYLRNQETSVVVPEK